MENAVLERKQQEDLERIRNLRLMDDEFMGKVFEDKACAEFLLRIILNRDDLTVQEVHGQHDLKNLQGRSVRLDILAVDEKNRVYNIEVQRGDHGAAAKRARYNSSLLDANLTSRGDDYEQLNETYVIFIAEHDVLKGGLPIYHIDRTIRENGAVFCDEAHIIYVNAQIRDETALGRLMQDFVCTDPAKMNYPQLAQRARYFKENEKGVTTMSRIFEEIAQEAAYKKSVSIAEKLLKGSKMTYEEIAEMVELPVEEVKALDQKRSA